MNALHLLTLYLAYRIYTRGVPSPTEGGPSNRTEKASSEPA